MNVAIALEPTICSIFVFIADNPNQMRARQLLDGGEREGKSVAVTQLNLLRYAPQSCYTRLAIVKVGHGRR